MDVYQYQKFASNRGYHHGKNPESREIRILTLLPGKREDILKGELRIRPIAEAADNKTYESLSYCWGEPQTSMHIIVASEGNPDGGRLAVTPNLRAALCDFRLENEPRHLWIDAICINQDDLEEKNQQIPLMRQIYEGSIRTLVWLGEGTKESSPAIRLISKLKDAAEKAGPAAAEINIFSRQDLAKYGLPSLLSRDYVSLLSLLDLPWFQRAWIVQELAVSKQATVFWGEDSTDWFDLVEGIGFALRVPLTFVGHPAVSTFVHIAEEAENFRSGNCRLLRVLLRHRRCMAMNPRDKVYAFLGLINSAAESQLAIDVNYQHDLATIYKDVALRIAAQDRSLDILSLQPTNKRNTRHIKGLRYVTFK